MAGHSTPRGRPSCWDPGWRSSTRRTSGRAWGLAGAQEQAIPAGALLTPEVLTRGPALPSRGEALVGVALAPGAAPADGLVAGDLVRVVRLPVTSEESSQDGGGRLVLPAAPVWAAQPGKDGATVLTLRVAVEAADHIAGLSARGAVAVERVTTAS